MAQPAFHQSTHITTTLYCYKPHLATAMHVITMPEYTSMAESLIVRDTQSSTLLTVGDALKESSLLVTSDGLQSNKNEPLGDNGAQQAASTPKKEGPKAEASGTKSK